MKFVGTIVLFVVFSYCFSQQTDFQVVKHPTEKVSRDKLVVPLPPNVVLLKNEQGLCSFKLGVRYVIGTSLEGRDCDGFTDGTLVDSSKLEEFSVFVGKGRWEAITSESLDQKLLKVDVDEAVCRFKDLPFEPGGQYDLGTTTINLKTGQLGNCKVQMNPSEIVTPGTFEVFVAHKPLNAGSGAAATPEGIKPPIAEPKILDRSMLQLIGAASFGVTFIVTLLVLAVKFPHPTPFQYNVFRTVLALAAAGTAAMIPGFINIEVSAAARLLIRAGGALAVFVIVFFFNPAQLAIKPGSKRF